MEMKFSHLSGLCLASVLHLGCAHDPTLPGREALSKLLDSYQFEEVSPPSRLPAPGTIIRVIRLKPLTFNTVCTSKQAFGDAWASEIATSETVSSDAKDKLERTFSLDAEYRNLVGAAAGAELVEGVKMTLSNAKVLQITSASARMGTADSNCLAAATFRAKVAAGEITMITSALQADVEYSVEFKKGVSLSFESKAEILSGQGGRRSGRHWWEHREGEQPDLGRPQRSCRLRSVYRCSAVNSLAMINNVI
jgi:hypothetical protein